MFTILKKLLNIFKQVRELETNKNSYESRFILIEDILIARSALRLFGAYGNLYVNNFYTTLQFFSFYKDGFF